MPLAQGPLKGFNLGIIPANNPDLAILYGGSLEASGKPILKTFYYLDLNNHQIVKQVEITQELNWTFDFENFAWDQTVYRKIQDP